jgi:riboflavin kinase/FMN adenylyltransferase
VGLEPVERHFRTLPGDQPLPEDLRGGVVAIGNFDGVHLGHRAVLDRALSIARQAGRPAIALTFEPHPRSFFRPDPPLFRLTPPPLKAEAIAALGFDAMVEQHFDAAFAALEAGEFVTAMLAGRLGASHVVAGHDFHFGKGRSGTPRFLTDEGPRAGFAVTLVEARGDASGEVISSTRIRAALAAGDIALATALLGREWLVRGTVVRGKQIGRTLGYPTANLSLPPHTGLRHGIYAVRIRFDEQGWREGVASFGRRPTFDNGDPLLETFVFGFSGDLYGQQADIRLVEFLRGEEKFDSVEALVEQMHRDSAAARAILAAHG